MSPFFYSWNYAEGTPGKKCGNKKKMERMTEKRKIIPISVGIDGVGIARIQNGINGTTGYDPVFFQSQFVVCKEQEINGFPIPNQPRNEKRSVKRGTRTFPKAFEKKKEIRPKSIRNFRFQRFIRVFRFLCHWKNRGFHLPKQKEVYQKRRMMLRN